MTNVDRSRSSAAGFQQTEAPADASPRSGGDEVRQFYQWRSETLKTLNSRSRDEKTASLKAIVDKGRLLLSGKVRELSETARQGDSEFKDIYALNVERKQAAAALELARAHVEKLRPLQKYVAQAGTYGSSSYWAVRDALFEADQARQKLDAIQDKMDSLVAGQPALYGCIRRLENIIITESGKAGLEVDYNNILFGDR